ncbi:MAG: hypothetical protein WA705_27335 [Candidatus Ozemobacteraceae bacterium]
MHRKYVALLTVLVLLLSASSLFALHTYYEQNGDCYVLIGNGPYKGLYALNNLTGGAIQKLWDLKWSGLDLDAYGLAAHQEWVSGGSQKRLYIFAGVDTGWVNWTGNISRRMVPGPSFGVWSGAAVPPYIVHRYHGNPNQSPTGQGNHPQSTLNWKFNGFDYPCSLYPAATAGRPGYFEIAAGKWYHSLDHPVYSPYTYGGGGGGWVHYVVRENVQASFRDLKLHQFNRNTLALNPAPYPSTVANIKTGERSTMDKKGECVDGCITAVDNIILPGAESPYVDCSYSSINKSYLYRREPSKTAYDLIGKDGNSTVIGNPADLTTLALGVSSKNNVGDFVYVVGKNVINGWLAAAGAPYTIASLTDFAVSDQWWQTGGIAYVYDRTLRAVYKFVRNDLLGVNPTPEQINVLVSGELPDSIGADGFGHLYMARTERVPDAASGFVANDAYSYAQTWTAWNGDKYCRAYFRQDVFKTIFQRNYYTRVTAAIPGKIPLGSNQFIRDFYVPAAFPITNRAKWIWNGAITQVGANVQTDYRVEIAVINSATPPQVSGNRNGLLDNRGPLLFNSGTGSFYAATPDGANKFGDDQIYFFEVENYPRFDTNDVNTWAGPDSNGNGYKGEFVSTIKKTSIKYYWKVIQVKDYTGETVNNVKLNQEAAGTPGNYRYSATLSAGEYRIGVKMGFQYYNYDSLTPGSLAADKESALTAFVWSRGHVDGDGYSWVNMSVKGIPGGIIGAGGAIIMSGKPSFTYAPLSPSDPVTTPVYVIPESTSSAWSFCLRDNKNNFGNAALDRLLIMDQANPPIPSGIARMVPASNIWTEAKVFTWTVDLKRGTEPIFGKPLDTVNAALTGAQCAALFPLPSQPCSYKLKCKAKRMGTLKAYFPTTIVDPDGTIRTDWGDPVDVPIPIQCEGNAEVIVKDLTGPMATFSHPLTGVPVSGIFVNRTVLYGTTGETLVGVDSPPVSNPTDLIYVVADNNPMGNQLTGPYASFVDPYHHAPPARNLAVSHNYNSRFGQLVYPTVQTTIAPTPDDRPAWYRSNPDQSNIGAAYKVVQKDLVLTDFGTGDLAWLPASKYLREFSYRMYKISLADWKHFTSAGAALSYTYANNSLPYTNPQYGLVTKDASSAAGNTITTLLGIGDIVIRDNDRPNAFVELYDVKHDAQRWYLPTNMKASARTGWQFLAVTTEVNHNGTDNWGTNNIPGIDPVWKLVIGQPFGNLLTSPNAEFEIDVPVFMHAIFSDNKANASVESFELFAMDNTTRIATKTGTDDIRYLFRKPTTATQRYRIKLVVKDDARGWPTSVADPVNSAPTSGTGIPNKRIVEAYLDVYDARLDIRVIDRNDQRR